MKFSHHLFWRTTAVVTIGLFVFYFLIASSIEKETIEQTKKHLIGSLTIAAPRLLPALKKNRTKELNELMREFSRNNDNRLTIIHKNGLVRADSSADISLMENHLTDDRTEIIDALKKGLGVRLGFSETLGRPMLYVAIPFSEKKWVLRGAVPMKRLTSTLQRIGTKAFFAGIFVTLMILLATLLSSHSLRKSLRELTTGVRRFSDGNLNTPILLSGLLEFEDLAKGMNEMAMKLQDLIKELTAEQLKQKQIFSCVAEGIIAIDMDDTILEINERAKKLFNTVHSIKGTLLAEAIDSSDLLHLVEHTRATGSAECNIDFKDTNLKASGSELTTASGRVVGVVIAIQDLTHERNLERIRKDFVSNVSHELKTPITTIKGYLETLEDGALEDGEMARHFIAKGIKNIDRLRAIIDDLLILSRIEQEEGRCEVQTSPCFLNEVIKNALQNARDSMPEKNITITFKDSATITSKGNPILLEQALFNLIHNSMKYGGETPIEISLQHDSTTAHIIIKDAGPGIAHEEQQRIFERFYRIDSGRARSAGGTGLGLAIVKHIAQLHGGSISLTSTLGNGACFTLSLPQG